MNTIPMTTKKSTTLAQLITENEGFILAEWMREMKDSVRRRDLIKDSELRGECANFLQLMKDALEASRRGVARRDGAGFNDARLIRV